MVKVKPGNKEINLDGYFKKNLDLAKKVVKKDWDMIFIIDGAERAGKSNLAQQIAYYVDPTLNLDRIVFTPEQFEQAVLNAEKYQAIIWDEAVTGADSGQTLTNMWKAVKKMLVQMGQKNLYVFILIHSFFDLTKYLALWRSRALIHVYHDRFSRGYFKFYNEERKKYLYIKGKKFYEYKQGRPNFIGRFTKGYVVNDKAYREKKEVSLAEPEEEQTKSKIETRRKENIAGLLSILNKKGVNTTEISRLLREEVESPLTDSSLQNIQREYKLISPQKSKI